MHIAIWQRRTVVVAEGVETTMSNKSQVVNMDEYRKQNAHLGYPTKTKPSWTGMVQFMQIGRWEHLPYVHKLQIC